MYDPTRDTYHLFYQWSVTPNIALSNINDDQSFLIETSANFNARCRHPEHIKSVWAYAPSRADWQNPIPDNDYTADMLTIWQLGQHFLGPRDKSRSHYLGGSRWLARFRSACSWANRYVGSTAAYSWRSVTVQIHVCTRLHLLT